MTVRPAPIIHALVAYLPPIVGVVVATDVPRDRPKSFVQATRAGGARRNLGLSEPRVIVRCWGPTWDDAEDLAADTYAALDTVGDMWLSPEVWVAGATLTDPASDPDPVSGSPRLMFVYSPIVALKEIS